MHNENLAYTKKCYEQLLDKLCPGLLNREHEQNQSDVNEIPQPQILSHVKQP